MNNTLNILELENSALKAKYEGKGKKDDKAKAVEENMLELKQKLASIKKQARKTE